MPTPGASNMSLPPGAAPSAGPVKASRRRNAGRGNKGQNAEPIAADLLSTTGTEARFAIAIVIFFVIAFILVIAMKLLQERRAALADAVLSQAYAAANTAKGLDRSLTDIESFAGATALGLGTMGARQRKAYARKTLQILLQKPGVAGAAVLGQNGVAQSRAGTVDSQAAFKNKTALLPADKSGVFFRLAPVNGKVQIFALAPAGKASMLVVQIDPSALIAPGRQVQTRLVDGQGNLLGGSPASLPAKLLSRLQSLAQNRPKQSERQAISGFQIHDPGGQRYVVGAASVLAGKLRVYQLGVLHLNGSAWQRTLTFFILMTIAPLLVAGVLCVILLVQVDTLRTAREALAGSEKRFRMALEYARGGVWDWDTVSGQVYLTESMARMLGQPQAVTLAVPEFLALVHAEDRKALLAAMQAAPEAGDVDVKFRAANLPVWLHARGRPWRMQNAPSSGRIVGVAIEITEQKGIQARVHAAENRLRAALESMSESFVVWDVKRRLVLCNRKFSDFFGIDAELLRPGTPYDELEQAADPAIKAAHEGADPGTIELELADGRWVHLSERPTRDGGLVSIGTDITALKEQEKLLLRKEKDLHEKVADIEQSKKKISELAQNYQQEKIRAMEANSAKSEFLANMSHELRTPLNAINGFSEIMKNEMYGPLGDARYKEYVGDILGSGQHLLTLINDILDMSKIEAGKLSLQTETVYLDELIEQCTRIIRGRAAENGLKMVLDVGELPAIEADPRAVKQVIFNLLSNAIKFTPQGGTVTLKAAEEKGGIRVFVADTGIGIPKKHLPLICKPFVQIENQHSKSHKGSGLGLALSQSLVHLHGGQFELTSEEGIGTEVSFWLPPEPPQGKDQAPQPYWSVAPDKPEDTGPEAEELIA